MGHGNQHHAGLHMRNIDQIGASFEDRRSNYRYSYLFDRAPDDPAADEYIRNAPKRKKSKKAQSQVSRAQKTAGTVVGNSQRKPSKPIQKMLFSDVLLNDRRRAILFDLQMETMEPNRSFPSYSQMILLIHKSETFDPSVLTREQQRLYQIGLLNRRLMSYAATTPEAQNMLKQYVTRKSFGYETKKGRHLITIRSWK
ncbi:MAG: hypothetical protein ACLRRS_01255 [Faecalibacterium prausnitzii]